MILHILTASARPGLLPAWAAELAEATKSGVDLRWHVAFDLDRKYIGGQAVKNRMLDSIPESDPGWVWIGDDDNVLDVEMLVALQEYDEQLVDAVVFAQRRGSKVAAACALVDRVDAAQFVGRRQFIGAHRIPTTYNGDGHWIAGMAKRGRVVFDDRVLTRYNGRTC